MKLTKRQDNALFALVCAAAAIAFGVLCYLDGPTREANLEAFPHGAHVTRPPDWALAPTYDKTRVETMLASKGRLPEQIAAKKLQEQREHEKEIARIEAEAVATVAEDGLYYFVYGPHGEVRRYVRQRTPFYFLNGEWRYNIPAKREAEE